MLSTENKTMNQRYVNMKKKLTIESFFVKKEEKPPDKSYSEAICRKRKREEFTNKIQVQNNQENMTHAPWWDARTLQL